MFRRTPGGVGGVRFYVVVAREETGLGNNRDGRKGPEGRPAAKQAAKSAARPAGGRRGPSRTAVVIGLAALAFVAGFVALIVWDSAQRSATAPPGDVQEFDIGPANQHVAQGANVDYEQSPPVGGEHDPIWLNSGFYDAPVRDENAVHTLEHGGVWLAYSPDLPQEGKDRIREIVGGQDCVIASPFPDLSAPVVASAWGLQVALEGADDPDLERFVRAYRRGPQTAEPGASCSGGVGEPV